MFGSAILDTLVGLLCIGALLYCRCRRKTLNKRL